jgi:ATP-dependent helicase/nuclease subunit B
MTFDAPFGPFTLTAKADRIELDAQGAAVIDFKTGSTPSAKQVAQGFAPQLTLTGAILANGGFPGAPPTPAPNCSTSRSRAARRPGRPSTSAR